MKSFCPTSHPMPVHVSKRVLGYFGLAGLVFLLSFTTIYFVHRIFSEKQLSIDPNLFS